ncbi:MAG TPA: 30S ribosomal protein S8 [Tenericutes bacterium]|jgi:small subunit ribosomal protein S8|nr:30S ribosomal protein S8 [Mycoplasmatota bacterium]
MSMTDPIADMLTHIRNANQMKHPKVEMPTSNIKVEIARVLKDEGYIKDYEIKEGAPQSTLVIHLKYGRNEERVITGLKRISKPGTRVYAKADEVPRVLNGLGIAIVSTSKGIMSDRLARKEKIGGEIIAYVW